MQNKIICPNCGAENERYGKCEYCGSVIENIDDVTEKYISHGKQKVTIDERVLIQKYDMFEDKTETIFRYGDDKGEISFKFNTKDDGKDTICQEKIHFTHIQKKCEKDYYRFGYLDDCIIHADGQNYKIKYGTISNETLSAICKANYVGVKFRDCYNDAYFNQESIWLFVTMARTFYNTFIDSSCYNDAADKLYTYFEEQKNEEKIEKQVREIEWKRKREEEERQENTNIIKAIVANVIFFLPVFMLLFSLVTCH